MVHGTVLQALVEVDVVPLPLEPAVHVRQHRAVREGRRVDAAPGVGDGPSGASLQDAALVHVVEAEDALVVVEGATCGGYFVQKDKSVTKDLFLLHCLVHLDGAQR